MMQSFVQVTLFRRIVDCGGDDRAVAVAAASLCEGNEHEIPRINCSNVIYKVEKMLVNYAPYKVH